MAVKLIESAQARWRAVNAPHLVALVRAGARDDFSPIVMGDGTGSLTGPTSPAV
jgi:hypothetical protein